MAEYESHPAATVFPLAEYESHPAATVFPLMVGDEFDELVADIRSHGLLTKIVRMPSDRLVLLDGRNCYRACQIAGVEPRFEIFDGDDPVRFVISRNLRRRQLTSGQRAIVAARLDMLPRHRPTKAGRSAALSTKEAGHLLGVGERTVRRARAVIRRAVPEVVSAIEAGHLTVDAGAELAELGRRKQREVAAAAVAGNLRRIAPEANKARSTIASIARAIAPTELVALNALADVGDGARDPRARAGVEVLRKIVPSVKRRG